MVEEVERIGTEEQVQFVFEDREFLPQAGVKVECAGTAYQVTLSVLDTDRAVEIRQRFRSARGSAGKVVDCIVAYVDLGLQIGLITGEYGRIVVVKRSQVRVGVHGYGKAGTVADKAGKAPSSN